MWIRRLDYHSFRVPSVRFLYSNGKIMARRNGERVTFEHVSCHTNVMAVLE
jgi:hypothetical protein